MSGLKIVLLIIDLVICAIGFYFSKGQRQRRAVIVAVGSLVVLWIFLYSVELLAEWYQTVILFAVLSFLVPIGAYILMMLLQKKPKPQAKKPTTRAAVAPVAEPVEEPRIHPAFEPDFEPASLDSYENCYRKAEGMASRGIWIGSAIVFEESARLSQTSEDKCRALFAAVKSYISAKKTSDARRIVEQLQAEPDLSSANKMKLQAIAKMLE